MARKAMIEKDKRRSAQAAKKWEERNRLKKIIFDLETDPEEKLQAMIQLNKMPKNATNVRCRRRCQFTGRSRGYLRKFQMSRLCFREMANSGELPGVFKASW